VCSLLVVGGGRKRRVEAGIEVGVDGYGFERMVGIEGGGEGDGGGGGGREGEFELRGFGR
jgi:hypothetical protein